MMDRLLRRAAAFGIALAFSLGVFAQEGGAGGLGGFGGLGGATTGPASAPSAPSSTAPAPMIQLPSVQTPTITNQQMESLPANIREQIQSRQSQQAPQQNGNQPEALDNTLDRNDFQEFIAQTTGQRLPLYGYNLFQRAPSTFAPVENVPVTPDYVIGPGDELLIRAWGQIDVDYHAIVDRNGMISIPKVGSIPVAGVQYKDITQHIKKAVSRNFRNFELMVTMGQLRSIQIYVVGQARRPGAYTVSSLSTLVNAIFAAGGPSTRGSMRSIQLKRSNEVVTDLDLYDLLLRGDKGKDAALLPGDVIYFPPIGPLAAITGGVKNPAIYELKGPTVMATLLDYAGGLTTTAQTKRASIERIDNREVRVVDQFAIDMGGLARTIKDGDLLSIFTISPKFENAVTLRGNVAAPLRYPYQPGMRVKDLIPEKDALITPDYYLRKNLAARTEVVKQGELAASVRQLADEINWEYAVIERQNQNDLTTELIPFNLGKVVLENDPANNLPLKPGDIVTVFSKSDVGAPAQRRPVVVRLEGEVNYAGVYKAEPGETLRQLVTRIGGVTPKAYLFGAQFTRESARRQQEERLKQAIDQLEQDVQRASFTRAQNAVTPEDAAALKQQTAAQQALIARLRSLKPSGRIVLEMPEDATMANLPDIALEDGDRLFIPERPSMVSVLGTVFNESAFLYSPGKDVQDYLTQAGGPRKEADRKSIYVLRADGSVISARQSGFLMSSLSAIRPMPGDSIVVPEDFERTTLTRDLKDWTQILYQFGLGAAALKIIRD